MLKKIYVGAITLIITSYTYGMQQSDQTLTFDTTTLEYKTAKDIFRLQPKHYMSLVIVRYPDGQWEMLDGLTNAISNQERSVITKEQLQLLINLIIQKFPDMIEASTQTSVHVNIDQNKLILYRFK